MAYNTKPIVTDVNGNPISQYYNPDTDSYEPVEGSHGANKVLVENNDLSLIPILEKLSQLTGTVIDEETRKSNELQRIALYNQIKQMLENGELKGEKGDTGIGLNYRWQGTYLGIKREDETEFVYVDLKGEKGDKGDKGDPGVIENLTKQHVLNALQYTPVKSVNNVMPDGSGNVEIDIDISEIENRIGNVEDDILDLMSYVGDLENLDTTEKANLVLALNETYQELAAHKADDVTQAGGVHGLEYEEGVWTPRLTFNYADEDMTFSNQVGKYKRIGNFVVATINLTLTSKGTSTGNARILGLPYSAEILESSSLYLENVTFNSETQVIGFITDTVIELSLMRSANTRHLLTNSSFNDNSRIIATITYQI